MKHQADVILADNQADKRTIAQLRERCATLEQLLIECVRNGYVTETVVSKSWMRDVRDVVRL